MIGTTREPTIHRVFAVYSILLKHLDKCGEKLKRKRLQWKVAIWDALGAAKDKLFEYYEKTGTTPLYGIAILCDPVAKDRFWKEKHWQEDAGWETNYWVEFEHMLRTSYKSHAIEKARPLEARQKQRQKGVSLDDLVTHAFADTRPPQEDPDLTEIDIEIMEYRSFGKSMVVLMVVPLN